MISEDKGSVKLSQLINHKRFLLLFITAFQIFYF